MKGLRVYCIGLTTMVMCVLVVAGCGGGGDSGGGTPTPTQKTLAGSWNTTITKRTSTCGNEPTGTLLLTITQQSSNVFAMSAQGVYFGRRGDTSPFIITQQNNSITGTFNVAASSSDTECPTCAWTQTFTGTLDASGDSFAATLLKKGTGGECSSENILSFVRK